MQQETERAFRFEIRNMSRENVFLTTYYFGFKVKVEYKPGSQNSFDYGADKVPVPADHDWHVIRPQQSIAWTVSLPENFSSLSQASGVQYQESDAKLSYPLGYSTTLTMENVSVYLADGLGRSVAQL